MNRVAQFTKVMAQLSEAGESHNPILQEEAREILLAPVTSDERLRLQRDNPQQYNVSPRSLRRAYLDWVEEQVEAFKDRISRSEILRLADEVVNELRVSAEGQYQLTELLLCTAIDRRIVHMLNLPGYRAWCAERRGAALQLRIRGELRIHTGSIPLPVEIRDTQLKLVERVRSDAPIRLPLGKYLVSSTLPDGSVTDALVTVDNTSLFVDVHLDASGGVDPIPGTEDGGSSSSRLPATTEPSPLPGGTEAEFRGTSNPLSMDWGVRIALGRLQERNAGGGISTTDGPAREAVFLRMFRLHRFRSSRAVQPLETRFLGEKSGIVLLRVTAQEEKVIFAQFAAGGAVPLNVAIPVAAYQEATQCDLIVGAGVDDIVISPRFKDPLINMVVAYQQRGNVRAASDLFTSADVKTLLSRNTTNPIATAICGYIMLQLGRLHCLPDKEESLSDCFPWLSDAAIIDGEREARRGNHRAAIPMFLEAVRRGPPTFTQGFSLLVSRLGQYAHPRSAYIERRQHRECKKLSRRLAAWSTCTDFTSFLFSYRGADPGRPAKSQFPLVPTRTTELWFRITLEGIGSV
jgi:hypothetical protein